MSTAGARHLAESAQWMAAETQPIARMEPEPMPSTAVVPLYEAAAAHDGQDPEVWKDAFRRWVRMEGDLI